MNAPLIPKWEIELRREALLESTHASTSIEGNPLSIEEVTDLLIGRDITAYAKDKKEVLNYFEALEYLDKLKGRGKIDNKDILQLHKVITKGVLDNPENSGKYRSGNQYVYVGNRYTGEVTHRPPATKEVPGLMNEFIEWINNPKADEINPVIEAGIAHYELVRIHPFIDGNGRTARVLASLIILRRGFDTKRFFTLDDFYNSDKKRYYKALKEVNQTTLDLTDWTEYFCEGVAVSIKAVKEKVLSLTGGKEKTEKDTQIALDFKQIKLVEFLRKVGRITNKQVRELLSVSNKTAYEELQKLEKYKIIRKIGKGRSTHYVRR